jgi:peptidoglycan/LPS O-acetylase OafA/YrhL
VGCNRDIRAAGLRSVRQCAKLDAINLKLVPFPGNKMQYRREIDGLRALAVVPVILFHVGLEWFSGGFIGVDVFFVISGYLITTILIEEQKSGSISIAKFYERRARRILPVLILILLLSAAAGFLLLLPDAMLDFSRSMLATLIFASNIYFYLTGGYFSSASELKPLLHTWSLSAEEQYYILFPILLIIMRKFLQNATVWLLVALAIFSLLLAEWSSSAHPLFGFFVLPTRGWELLFGAIAAFVASTGMRDHITNKFSQLSEALAIIGLLGIIYSIFSFDKKTPFPGFYAIVPVLGSTLIILFSSSQSLVGRILGTKPLVGIGLISYSAYLWHQPVFAFARIVSDKKIQGIEAYGLLLLVFVLSFFSWKYVEQVFRDKNKIPLSKLLKLLGGACAGLAIFAIGLNNSASNKLNYIMPTSSDDLQRRDECFLLNVGAEHLRVDRCVSHAPGKINILLLGDSHAASLYPGLKEFADTHNINLSSITAAFCLPLVKSFPKNSSTTATPRCEKINKKIQEAISSNKFDLIIISSYMLQWGFAEDWNWTYPGYYKTYLEEASQLNKSSPILVIGELPVWVGGLPTTFFKNKTFSHIENEDQYSKIALNPNLFNTNKKMKEDFSSLKIPYISMTDNLCKEGACMRYVTTPTGAQLMSFDYGHLGLAASRHVANNIIGPKILEMSRPNNN